MKGARTLIDSTLIPHTAFENASSRLEQCFDYAADAAEPICVAIIGESRTGKSRVLEECCASHSTTRQADGLTVPILRVKTPSKPTVKGLAELMLRAMGDPRFYAGTEITKTSRLKDLMKKCNTRMVMIDEFQHFYDKASHKVMHYVADWLKILVDDSHVALTVAGLPSCMSVVNQNEQLEGRFQAPVVMPRFDWTRGEHREEFTAVLGAFHQAMSDEFDLPELDSDEMAFRCYCATGGLMGYLSKFLRQAVWNALDSQRREIRLEDLAEAHRKSMWSASSKIGALASEPFSKTFQCAPTEDVLAMVRQIGEPKVADELVERPRRRRVIQAPDAVSSVLSAR